MDVSDNALLRRVTDGQLDVAFVHEVEGCPLHVPRGPAVAGPRRARTPVRHAARRPPAAAGRVVRPADLADDRWMVDPTVDGEWDGVHRMLRAVQASTPRVLHGDYHTAASPRRHRRVVTVCQPSSQSRPDTAVRRLYGDPLGVRLLLAARTRAELDAVYPALEEAYWEVARRSTAYREWLEHLGPRLVPAAP